MTKLARSVDRSVSETRASRYTSMAVAGCALLSTGFVAYMGAAVLRSAENGEARFRAIDQQVAAWDRQVEAWEGAQARDVAQRTRELEASASLAAALQKSIEADAAHTYAERRAKMDAAEKHAVAAEVKALSVQLERTKGDAGAVEKRYDAANRKAKKLGVRLDEF